MGSFWARCCRCDDGDDDSETERRGVQANESLLTTRRSSASVSPGRGDQSPEEERSTLGRFLAIYPAGTASKNPQMAEYVQLLKMKPSSAEEEREFMVRSFSSGMLSDVQPECMLCLEGFTAAHPSAVSLCGCGVKKDTFHLDCLMEWRRKSNKTNCPICENELYVDGTVAAPQFSSGASHPNPSTGATMSLT